MKLITLLSLALVFFLRSNAHAYLDPGTGSYIFQVLAATLLGTLFSLRIFWARIKKFIRSILSKKHNEYP